MCVRFLYVSCSTPLHMPWLLLPLLWLLSHLYWLSSHLLWLLLVLLLWMSSFLLVTIVPCRIFATLTNAKVL